uniref:Ig-like domain-containing protein n=1 Tax=Angiostrongylus cantonensis TaxID=6313 RepID=A0A0K0DQ11_ANGCA
LIVNVMTPPRIERAGIPADIEEISDRPATISCPVYGKPVPTVAWLKGGRPLGYQQNVKTSANGQKLYFLNLGKNDAGRYTCVARNAAGEDNRDFTIKLLGIASLKKIKAPSFEGPNLVRRVQVNAGRPSILNCPATGSPTPDITWFKYDPVLFLSLKKPGNTAPKTSNDASMCIVLPLGAPSRLRDGQTLSPSSRHVFLDGGRQLQISHTQLEDKARRAVLDEEILISTQG